MGLSIGITPVRAEVFAGICHETALVLQRKSVLTSSLLVKVEATIEHCPSRHIVELLADALPILYDLQGLRVEPEPVVTPESPRGLASAIRRATRIRRARWRKPKRKARWGKRERV